MRRTEAATTDWRALPVAAVAALYVNGVQRFLRENLFAFTGAGTGIALSDALGWREFLAITALVLLVGLLLALIYHRRFRYRIDTESIRVRQGLLERTELEVRFERVQNIGFSQPFYLRPLRLRRVTLETPGAAQTEVQLPGIAEEEALALRELVDGARQARTADGDSAQDEDSARAVAGARPGAEQLFRAGTAELFRHGLTSNQIWFLFAFVGAPAANWIDARIERALDWMSEAGVLAPATLDAPWMAAGLVLVPLTGFALLLMLLSGVLAVVRYHGYALSGDDERLRARFGLLDAREHTLRRAKLHSVELVQTAVGRLLGDWHVIGHQTGAAQFAQQAGPEDRRFLVPGVGSARLAEVVGALRQRPWTRPELRGVDRRLRTIQWMRLCAPLMALAVGLRVLAPPETHGVASALAALALLSAAIAHLRWKRWGWLCDGELLIVRSGLAGQRWIVFDLDRCQQVRITSSPYQRRHGLATLHLRLPHGEQTVPYIAADSAAELANRALLAAERSTSHAL